MSATHAECSPKGLCGQLMACRKRADPADFCWALVFRERLLFQGCGPAKSSKQRVISPSLTATPSRLP